MRITGNKQILRIHHRDYGITINKVQTLQQMTLRRLVLETQKVIKKRGAAKAEALLMRGDKQRLVQSALGPALEELRQAGAPESVIDDFTLVAFRWQTDGIQGAEAACSQVQAGDAA